MFYICVNLIFSNNNINNKTNKQTKQNTRELISVRETSQKYRNKDLSIASGISQGKCKVYINSIHKRYSLKM